jgi:UDP-N-acetylmuramate dehydrogenase
MQILKDVPLGLHSTMRLGGKAAYATDVYSKDDIIEALDWANQKGLQTLMIGSGSNIIWRDEGFPGLLLVNKIKLYESYAEDEENYYISLGGGEIWDEVVAKTVAAGLSGIEALSLIPGTVGATPIQNVGAYGQEISQTLVSLEAYDTKTQQLVIIPASDCGFAYRTSRFKTDDHNRFLIIKIVLHLIRGSMQPPFYSSLQKYFDEHNLNDYSPQVVRDAVVAIRRSKLPDPAQVANNGSFFANPIINEESLTQLINDHPDLSYWPQDNGQVKLSAAWLVEHAGFSNAHDTETGMATWPSQCLVLVNEHAKNTADLLNFKQKILTAVQQKFDVSLEQEPELLP